MAISDFYSALFLILGGFAGLFMLQVTTYFNASRRIPVLSERLEAIRLRLESRRRWSWVMVIFGSLWMIQLIMEQGPHLPILASY